MTTPDVEEGIAVGARAAGEPRSDGVAAPLFGRAASPPVLTALASASGVVGSVAVRVVAASGSGGGTEETVAPAIGRGEP